MQNRFFLIAALFLVANFSVQAQTYQTLLKGGHLSVGAIADVTVLNLREGKFGFYDVARFKKEGKNLLECEMTIKGGRVVYDLNALSFPLAK